MREKKIKIMLSLAEKLGKADKYKTVYLLEKATLAQLDHNIKALIAEMDRKEPVPMQITFWEAMEVFAEEAGQGKVKNGMWIIPKDDNS
jgi:hypothetical protein